MKAIEFTLAKILLLTIAMLSVSVPLHGEEDPSQLLGRGDPGLKIIYKSTNEFVIYDDEPWTFGAGLVGGYDERTINILLERNYGLRRKIQTRSWNDIPKQLYPFGNGRTFTCEVGSAESNWPHATVLFSLDGASLSQSNDLYEEARKLYGLTPKQLFLGKIGSNIYYWQWPNARKIFYQSTSDAKAVRYLELPKGVEDVFGVAKSVKKDVFIEVFRRSTGFFHLTPFEFSYIDLSLSKSRPTNDG
jgi:hypothetical protein